MWQRVTLSIICGLGTMLMLFGAFYNHFIPRSKNTDIQLALQMLPVEIAVGVILGVLVYVQYGKKSKSVAVQPGNAERMLIRLFYRSGGEISMADLSKTPLPEQAAAILHLWQEQGKVQSTPQHTFKLL